MSLTDKIIMARAAMCIVLGEYAPVTIPQLATLVGACVEEVEAFCWTLRRLDLVDVDDVSGRYFRAARFTPETFRSAVLDAGIELR